MVKKSIALAIAVLMLVSMFSGCNSGSSAASTAATTKAAATSAGATTAATTAAPAESGKLFEEPTTFTMWIVEHVSYLYNPENFLQKKMGELWNVYLDVTPYQDAIGEKINLALASGDLPELAHNIDVTSATNWGLQGALLDFKQYEEDGKMPNYTAWNADMGDYSDYFMSPNGAMYVMPHYGYGEASNNTFWMYRKDIFDKNDLVAPTTDEEVYQVCKKLKEIYPDSYPFCVRSWPSILERIAWQWNAGGSGMYFSNDTKAWEYGPLDAGFEECMIWLNKMYSEGLMAPNTLSLDTAGWQEIVSTNKGFILNDYQSRIDFFNNPMRQSNPESTFLYMPPFKGGENGVTTFNGQSQLITSGYIAFSTTKQADSIVKFMDYMFTPEGENLMSWGVEGESYKVNADGSKDYLDLPKGSGTFEICNKYGFFQRGFWCLIDPDSMLDTSSDEVIAANKLVREDRGEYRIPSLSFTEANKEEFDRINEALSTLTLENIGKFVTGQRPISEYGAFKDELKAAGIQNLIDLYNKQQGEIDALKK